MPTGTAHQHLALYLEADVEEEDGHEGVVDELDDGHGVTRVRQQVEAPYLQAHLLCPEVVVEGIEPGNVGHDEGEYGGAHQHVASAGVMGQSAACGEEYFAWSR